MVQKSSNDKNDRNSVDSEYSRIDDEIMAKVVDSCLKNGDLYRSHVFIGQRIEGTSFIGV